MLKITGEHDSYCLEIAETRRGCYCWEGGQKLLSEMRLSNVAKERDHYKRIAEEAVSNLEQAVKLLQAFQAVSHD